MEFEQLQKFREVKKCLAGKAERTKNVYLGALRIYTNYRDMNPEELIDEIEADRQKTRRERGEIEYIIKTFHEWLLNEKPKLSKGKKPTGEKGVSTNRANSILCGVRSFYKANGFPLNVKTPKSYTLPENEKLKVRADTVKKLVNHAPTLRDRAIILAIFQSGMDASTLCSLKYGDVAKGLEAYKNNGEQPMLIKVVRKKAHVNFNTFLAKDAIEALLAYLNKRQEKEGKIGLSEPLFVKERVKNDVKSLNTKLIDKMMRKVALRSGVVSQEEMERADMNPCRPHALRAAFKTVLMLQGVPKELTEYWMGHTPDYGGAYHLPSDEEQLEIYADNCEPLSINRATEQVKELSKEMREEIGELQMENRRLRKKLADMEQSKEQQMGEQMLKAMQDNPELMEQMAGQLAEVLAKKQES